MASVCGVSWCSCGFVRSSFAGNELKGDGVIKHWMEIRLCKVSLTIRHQVLPQGVYFRLSLLISISIPFTCVRGFLSFDWSRAQHHTINRQQTWLELNFTDHKMFVPIFVMSLGFQHRHIITMCYYMPMLFSY